MDKTFRSLRIIATSSRTMYLAYYVPKLLRSEVRTQDQFWLNNTKNKNTQENP